MQFLANWESLPFKLGFFCYLGMFQVNWEFFQPIGKKFGTGNRTQFCIEKKPCKQKLEMDKQKLEMEEREKEKQRELEREKIELEKEKLEREERLEIEKEKFNE